MLNDSREKVEAAQAGTQHGSGANQDTDQAHGVYREGDGEMTYWVFRTKNGKAVMMEFEDETTRSEIADKINVGESFWDKNDVWIRSNRVEAFWRYQEPPEVTISYAKKEPE